MKYMYTIKDENNKTKNYTTYLQLLKNEFPDRIKKIAKDVFLKSNWFNRKKKETERMVKLGTKIIN